MGHFLRLKLLGALILLWACPTCAAEANITSNLVLEFAPEKLTLIEEDIVNVTLNIRDNSTSEDLAKRPWMASPGLLTVISDTPYNLDVLNGTFEVTPCDFLEDKNYTVLLRANSLGYANLEVFWEQLEDTRAAFNLSSCSDGTFEPDADEAQPSSPSLVQATSSQLPEDWTTSIDWTVNTTTRAPLKAPVYRKATTPEQATSEDATADSELPDAIVSPEEHSDGLPNSDVVTEGENEETDQFETDMHQTGEDVVDGQEDGQNEKTDQASVEQEDDPNQMSGMDEPTKEEEEPNNEEEPANEEEEPTKEEEEPNNEEEEPTNKEEEPANEEEEPTNEEEEPTKEEEEPTKEEEEPTKEEEEPNNGEEEPTNEEEEPTNEEEEPANEEEEPTNEEEEAKEEDGSVDAPPLASDSLVYESASKEPAQQPKDSGTSSQEAPLEVPDVPVLKPKTRPAKKFQVYKEGTTFLFKRSQELSVEEEAATATKILLSNSYKVTILRDAGTLDTVFVVVVSMAVIINTLMMGMQIDLANVVAILKKPIGPAVGFFSQFAFMPAASYALGLLLLSDPNLRLGLFTLGCSPGGNGSNFWTLLLKGDLNLSITMTLISTTASLFMMPMWLYTLGQTILEEGKIGIPFTNLILSLFSFTIPVAVGLSIRRCKPAWANFAAKIIRPFTLVLIITLLALSIWNSTYIFRLITWQMIVAGLCIAWGGYVFGAFMAWVCRQKRAQIIAISIETAIQNPGITFMVLRLTLPQPDSDISAVAPVAQLLVTSTPLLLSYLSVMIYRRCKACKNRKMEEQLQEANQRDLDAADPLIINRTSIVVPSNGTAKNINGYVATPKDAGGHTPIRNRRETPPPPYPGVNMYAEQSDRDLEKNDETTFAKVLASKQDSVDAVPVRKSDHIYENFRNGKQIEQLRESKV